MARDVSTGIFYTAVAGGVIALLANLDDIKNSKEAKDHWWLLPVGLIALGYMLRKKRHAHAGAVVAVGGALFALAYSAHQKAQQAQQTQQPPNQGGDTAGPYAGALPVGAQRGLWLQLPDGQFVRVPVMSRKAAPQTRTV